MRRIVRFPIIGGSLCTSVDYVSARAHLAPQRSLALTPPFPVNFKFFRPAYTLTLYQHQVMYERMLRYAFFDRET